MTAPIGLFYGSSTCYTEIAAEKIATELGEGRVQLFNLADTPVAEMSRYQYIILGIPTWDYGELQEDWENCWDDLDQVDFHGKTVALYGLGDQEGYPDWFQDALGYLWAKISNLGAKTVGLWPNQGYSFDQSKALTSDESHFVGLALDEDIQFDLSDERIKQWCQKINVEFDVPDHDSSL